MKFVAEKLHGIAGYRGTGRSQGIAALTLVLTAHTLGTGRADASPPSPREAPFTRTLENPRSSGAVRNEIGRLDLRPPTSFGAPHAEPAFPAQPSASSSVPFPSARRALQNGADAEQPREELLGNAKLQDTDLPMKNTSRAEELTHRLHREGLPVARLFETRSAMVSLGLSPRGKPGIWLIQKVP
jgi:hypothetical protein